VEVAYGEAVDWVKRSSSLERIGVMGSVNWPLTLDGPQPESLLMAAVSASFFDVIGRRTHLGRTLVEADEVGAVPRVAVISHALWVRRFGHDPRILGRRLPARITDERHVVPMEIVGVMPEGFDFPRGAEVWAPAAPLVRANAAAWTGGNVDVAMRWLRVFYAVGRLRPGVTVQEAAAGLSQIIRTTDTQGGPPPPTDGVVTGVRAFLLGPVEPVLWTLLGGTALMLLVACANVAGLHVARGSARARMLAIRLTLGARPGQLAWQSIAESLLLTLAAIVVSVAVAQGAVRVLVWLAPTEVLRIETVTLFDARVALFAAAAALLTAVASGLWPALVVGRTDALTALTHGRTASSQPAARRIQRLVVAGQVALALTLLVGTALFVRTIRGLDRTVLGFDPEGLLSVELTPNTSDLDAWNRTSTEIERRVAALPGIASVGSMYLRPLSGPIGLDSQPVLAGQPENDPYTWGLNPHLNHQTVTPGFFATMRMTVERGRGFLESDTIQSPGVVIVSRSAAERLWPGRDPIGQRLFQMSYRPAPGAPPYALQTVVGVVNDARYRGLNDLRLDMYVPAAQANNRVAFLMVRADSHGDPIAGVRSELHAIDPRIGVGRVEWMSQIVSAESAPWRFLVRVFLAFAASGALLASIGLGAVIALAVDARRRELAIRAALGADRRRLRTLVMREGTLMVIAGIAVGLAASLALGRLISGVLVGVGADDPTAIGAAATIVIVVTLAACWWPSRRAGEADPVEALRAE
jgi:predicted permease